MQIGGGIRSATNRSNAAPSLLLVRLCTTIEVWFTSGLKSNWKSNLKELCVCMCDCFHRLGKWMSKCMSPLWDSLAVSLQKAGCTKCIVHCCMLFLIESPEKLTISIGKEKERLVLRCATMMHRTWSHCLPQRRSLSLSGRSDGPCNCSRLTWLAAKQSTNRVNVYVQAVMSHATEVVRPSAVAVEKGQTAASKECTAPLTSSPSNVRWMQSSNGGHRFADQRVACAWQLLLTRHHWLTAPRLDCCFGAVFPLIIIRSITYANGIAGFFLLSVILVTLQNCPVLSADSDASGLCQFGVPQQNSSGTFSDSVYCALCVWVGRWKRNWCYFFSGRAIVLSARSLVWLVTHIGELPF